MRSWRDNFAELKKPLVREEARVEASRCLYCYDAPCVKACPTHIDVPRFIRQIAAADPLGAGETILEANALGHSCARVCPVEVLCEGACVYHDWHEKPIQIARLQRFATDAVHASDELPFESGPDNGKHVAVVGAGPAGAACATYLRRLGCAVTIFEKRKLPGGLNTFGVAEYKMDCRTSLEELRFLFRLGCSVKTGVEVDAQLAAKLQEDFDAVFLGIGLARTRRLGIPGENLPGVLDALTFIESVKGHDAKLLDSSAATVVIGGGNTAIDAVTQSKRTGTGKVLLAYRRGRENMSAYDFEIELAKSDGVEMLMNAAPKRILGKKKVEGVDFVPTRIVKGKRIEGLKRKFTVPCDRVITAIGQEKDRGIAELFGVALNADGTIKVSPETLTSSKPTIFAGGDAVNGGKEVVNAVADGKRAAWSIHRALHPGAEAGPDDAYWVSTINGRAIAPITPRRERA